MNGIIKQLTGKITEMYRHSVGLWLYFIHKIDERRLCIALKATGYSCHVDEVVRLKNDKLRHQNRSTLIPTHTHEIKLSTFPKHIIQVIPLGLSITSKHLIILAVAYLYSCTIVFFCGKDKSLIPFLYNHTKHILLKLSPTVFPVDLRKMCL